MDQKKFRLLCEAYRDFGPVPDGGIGTLGEKSLHAVLKQYYQPEELYREVRIGRYVADVVTLDGCILEVQTRSLGAIRKKLECFLEQYEVTLVHPIPHLRWMRTVDGETGLLSPKRRCGREGVLWDAFRELASIRDFLRRPNLKICIPLVDLEELRLKGSRRKSRLERFPLELAGEFWLDSPQAYQSFLPGNLPEAFTSAELSAAGGMAPDRARLVLYVLLYAGAVERVGKIGNRYVYRLTSNEIGMTGASGET